MIVIGFLFSICLGYLLADIFCPQISRYLKGALSILLGWGSISLILFVGFALGVFSSKNSVFIALGIIMFVVLVVKMKFPRHVSSKSSFKLEIGYLESCIFLVIMILFVLSLAFSVYYPIMVSDGNDYVLTGHLIALDKKIDTSTYFLQKPPLIPLLYTFFSLLGEHNEKFIFPFMYLSLIACFYFCLRSLDTERRVIALFTLILSTTPFLWWHSFLGLLNLPAGVFFSAATFFWYIHLLKDEKATNGEILLSSILYAFSIWTRLEFLLYFTVPLLILCFSEKGVNKKVILFSIAPMLIAALWISFYHLRFQISDSLGQKEILAWVSIFILLIVSYGLFQLKKEIVLTLLKIGSSFLVLLTGLLMYFNSDFYIALKTRVIETLLQPIFWTSSSALFILVFWEKLPFVYARKCLLTFIIGYLFIHVIFHTLLGGGNLSGMDFLDIVKYYIASPGNRINTPSSREYLAFYPIVIFYFALSKKIGKACTIRKSSAYV